MTDNETRDDIREIRSKLDVVCQNVARLSGESRMTIVFIKWVVSPLILIVGGLAGVNFFM
jgi:hypothetical protein